MNEIGRAVKDPDGWKIRTRDGSLAAHHEHTPVITRGRPVLLPPPDPHPPLRGPAPGEPGSGPLADHP